MRILSRTEEMMILAVRALEPAAYGLSIGEFLEEHSGKAWSVGAIYIPLERLRKRGLLGAFDGDPTPERGGRRKRFYRVTSKGLDALSEVKRLHDVLWATATR